MSARARSPGRSGSLRRSGLAAATPARTPTQPSHSPASFRATRHAPKARLGHQATTKPKPFPMPFPLRAGVPRPAGLLGLEHRSDLALEGLDVRGEDLTRPRGVAGGDCPQQFVVLVHAREQMRQAVEHQVPDPQREIEVATERLLEIRVARAM